MQTVKVQINYVDGKEGMYECTKRPYFTYENNTAMLHLNDGSTLVVNMLQVISMIYEDKKQN